MIVSKEIRQYEKDVKFLTYTIDQNGNPAAIEDMPEIAGKEDLGKALYYTKALELERLKKEVLNGNISPVKLLMSIQNMNEDDIAHRMKIPLNKVKKHFTIEGFRELKVKDLLIYAKIFDMSVADLFQFLNFDKDYKYETKNYHDRLIQDITIK